MALCAPPCPKCKLPLATPIDLAEVDRWDAWPEACRATLYCPSCGIGWVGTLDDLASAEASWREYEAEMSEETEPERTVLDAIVAAQPDRDNGPAAVPVLPGQRKLFE